VDDAGDCWEEEGEEKEDDEFSASPAGQPIQKRGLLKVVTLNVQGINDNMKRRALFQWLKLLQADIILLTETHLALESKIPFWRKGWGGKAGERNRWWGVSKSALTVGVAICMKGGGMLMNASVTHDGSGEG